MEYRIFIKEIDWMKPISKVVWPVFMIIYLELWDDLVHGTVNRAQFISLLLFGATLLV